MNGKRIAKETGARIGAFLQEMSECTSIAACFDCIFNAIPDGAVFVDLQRKIVMINPALENISGYSEEELIGRTTEAFYVSREAFEEQGRIRYNLSVEEELRPYEVEYRRKDGTIFPSETVGSVVKDDEGNKIGFLGLIRDISDRKQSEARLSELECMYRTVADFTYDWEAWTNLDGTFRYVSPSCERISGYAAEAFIENPMLFRDIIVAEDRKLWDTHFYDSIQELGLREIQFRIVRPDGEVRWIEHACQPVINGKKQVLGFRSSNRDITDRKKTEDELRAALIAIGRYKEQLEAESACLREEIQLVCNHGNIIGSSNALKYVLFKIEQIASTDTTVLVLGETGTGKELIARAIHKNSRRKKRPLIKVNCAALPSDLIESELFGHERGAFTGAHARRIGRFEVADRATIFLDEIGELPPEIQVKLLRVLQDGEFERVGSSRTIKVDVRIIAATNRDLEQDVRNDVFRKDLWYRLNVFPITAPPLRDRLEDIPQLAAFFMNRFARKQGKTITTVPARIMEHLQQYSWPGNIRELENVIERAVINSAGPKLLLADELRAPQWQEDVAFKSLQEMERDYIIQVLEETNWKVSGKNSAAEILQLDRSTLRSRMKKLGIARS